MTAQHLTEYRVTFEGSTCMTTGDKAQADQYIIDGIKAGQPAAAYGIDHRAVIIQDWHPTTGLTRAQGEEALAEAHRLAGEALARVAARKAAATEVCEHDHYRDECAHPHLAAVPIDYTPGPSSQAPALSEYGDQPRPGDRECACDGIPGPEGYVCSMHAEDEL